MLFVSIPDSTTFSTTSTPRPQALAPTHFTESTPPTQPLLFLIRYSATNVCLQTSPTTLQAGLLACYGRSKDDTSVHGTPYHPISLRGPHQRGPSTHTHLETANRCTVRVLTDSLPVCSEGEGRNTRGIVFDVDTCSTEAAPPPPTAQQ